MCGVEERAAARFWGEGAALTNIVASRAARHSRRRYAGAGSSNPWSDLRKARYLCHKISFAVRSFTAVNDVSSASKKAKILWFSVQGAGNHRHQMLHGLLPLLGCEVLSWDIHVRARNHGETVAENIGYMFAEFQACISDLTRSPENTHVLLRSHLQGAISTIVFDAA